MRHRKVNFFQNYQLNIFFTEYIWSKGKKKSNIWTEALVGFPHLSTVWQGILNKTICELGLYKIIGFRLWVESWKSLKLIFDYNVCIGGGRYN